MITVLYIDYMYTESKILGLHIKLMIVTSGDLIILLIFSQFKIYYNEYIF